MTVMPASAAGIDVLEEELHAANPRAARSTNELRPKTANLLCHGTMAGSLLLVGAGREYDSGQ
jgi:hypothetical protein